MKKKYLVLDYINCSIGNRCIGSRFFSHIGNQWRKYEKMDPCVIVCNFADCDRSSRHCTVKVRKLGLPVFLHVDETQHSPRVSPCARIEAK